MPAAAAAAGFWHALDLSLPFLLYTHARFFPLFVIFRATLYSASYLLYRIPFHSLSPFIGPRSPRALCPPPLCLSAPRPHTRTHGPLSRYFALGGRVATLFGACHASPLTLERHNAGIFLSALAGKGEHPRAANGARAHSGACAHTHACMQIIFPPGFRDTCVCGYYMREHRICASGFCECRYFLGRKGFFLRCKRVRVCE